MKIEVTDKEVRITWQGVTRICNCEELVEQFKEAKPREYDLNRKMLAVKFWDSSLFKTISKPEPKPQRRLSTLDILEACVRETNYRPHDPYIEEQIDDLLGADPYTPLY